MAVGLVGIALLHHYSASPVYAQSVPVDVKHVIVAPAHGPNATLSALNIVRGASYPSIVHLSGSVEIKVIGFILSADEANYNEDTGEVEAQGKVTVKPYPQRSK